MRAICLFLLSLPLVWAADSWETVGFQGFRQGSFGNGGQNLYVSRGGVLQRILQSDINGDGRSTGAGSVGAVHIGNPPFSP